MCYKWGEAGHPATSCTGIQTCFLCVKEDPTIDCGHLASSGACADSHHTAIDDTSIDATLRRQ